MGKNYTGTFKTATRNGKSPYNTIQRIANNSKNTPNQVCNTLCKDHTCFSKPFNGQKFCFPTNFGKTNRNNSKVTEFHFWQYAIEFAVQQGWVTPEQVYSWSNEQLFWFVTNKLNSFYSKPKNFNPRAKVNGFPASWTGTATPVKKTKKAKKTKTRNKKRTTARKPAARKSTPKKTSKTRRPRKTSRPTARRRTTQKPKLRLVGGARPTTRRRRAA